MEEVPVTLLRPLSRFIPIAEFIPADKAIMWPKRSGATLRHCGWWLVAGGRPAIKVASIPS